jgi:predicted HAD superfamily Cof-like phosphohydrolase
MSRTETTSILIEKIDSVREFHEVFSIGSATAPTLIEEGSYALRHRLMAEETEEYLEACKKGDLVEIADALGDQLYILFGTILKHGLQHKIEEVFDEIHRSNMSKLDANGKPVVREDGKILKSELYFRPDIRKILEK